MGSSTWMFIYYRFVFRLIIWRNIFWFNKNDAISIINQDPNIKSKLGDNIETDGMFSGNISTSNDTGEMNISVPVKGSKGTGKAIIVAEKEFDKWNYEKIAVQIDETGEVIQIQKQY